jgi:hypothetical protein
MGVLFSKVLCIRTFYAQDIRVPQLPIAERLVKHTDVRTRAYSYSKPHVEKQEKS